MKKRIHLIDTLRGIAITAMIFHHVSYALEDFYGVTNFYTQFFHTDAFDVLQFIFVAIFVLISGISCSFSRNNFKRGAICFGFGALVTVATLIVSPDYPTFFGILHFLGVSMMLYALAAPFLEKLSAKKWAVIFSIIFIVNYALYVHFQFNPSISTNAFFVFGVISPTFTASDYYPLLPYLWLFLAGAMLGRIVTARKAPSFVYNTKPVPFFTWVGRHTMCVYILHMPIALGIMELLRLGGLI